MMMMLMYIFGVVDYHEDKRTCKVESTARYRASREPFSWIAMQLQSHQPQHKHHHHHHHHQHRMSNEVAAVKAQCECYVWATYDTDGSTPVGGRSDVYFKKSQRLPACSDITNQNWRHQPSIQIRSQSTAICLRLCVSGNIL